MDKIPALDKTQLAYYKGTGMHVICWLKTQPDQILVVQISVHSHFSEYTNEIPPLD